MDSVTEIHNLTQYRDQQIMGSLALTEPYISQLLWHVAYLGNMEEEESKWLLESEVNCKTLSPRKSWINKIVTTAISVDMLTWEGGNFVVSQSYTRTTGFWDESEPLPGMSPLIDSLRQESQPGNNMHTHKRNKPSRLYLYIFVHTRTHTQR